MTTLLGRQLTGSEQKLQAALARLPADMLRRSRHTDHGALAMRDEYYAPALSLVEVPITSEWQRELCAYLIAQPGFLTYLAQPDTFSEFDSSRICRVLIEVDDMVDVKLANAMRSLHDRNHGADAETIVRLLGVLDRISPGRRVIMSIIHLLREAHPAAASKAALFLGKRVQNPEWVERQMTSSDPRVRANVIESIWGVDNSKARKSLNAALKDDHNRVVGNALIGLHLLRDPSVAGKVRTMLRHSDPKFRATGAWVMGKVAAPEFRTDLNAAANDESEQVRDSAVRALEFLPPVEPEVSVTLAMDSITENRDTANIAPELEPATRENDESQVTLEPAVMADGPEDAKPEDDFSYLMPSRAAIPFVPHHR
jgi:hypothetical protein